MGVRPTRSSIECLLLSRIDVNFNGNGGREATICCEANKRWLWRKADRTVARTWIAAPTRPEVLEHWRRAIAKGDEPWPR